jgi:hypothetical protein
VGVARLQAELGEEDPSVSVSAFGYASESVQYFGQQIIFLWSPAAESNPSLRDCVGSRRMITRGVQGGDRCHRAIRLCEFTTPTSSCKLHKPSALPRIFRFLGIPESQLS